MALTALLTAMLLAAPPTDSFPHGAHRRLFASCLTCHAGIMSGDSAAARPAPPACASCHDGNRERRVTWTPGAPRPTNLRFDHRRHAAELTARGDSVRCVACHANGPQFMDAGRAPPERCLACHEPRAPSHFAAANCASCHRPLRDVTRFAASNIAALPRPASHDSGWVFRHGAEATGGTCAFCHTSESCSSCHVNARRLPAIAALGRNREAAAAVAAHGTPALPRPASHRTPDFQAAHGALANAAGATCASCHTRESCVGCHRSEERVAAIAALPRREEGGAMGVRIASSRPADHVPGFAVRHRAAAAAGERSCASCHAPTFCASCHDAPRTPVFHGRNFVARHAAESFGQTTECASCHQKQAFCTACHAQTGRAAGTGAARGRYHDGQAQWAFAHGAVARRSIETCASCHRQSDCMQCHSARGGQGISPHGRGFDPGMERKNPALCARCHLGGAPRG